MVKECKSAIISIRSMKKKTAKFDFEMSIDGDWSRIKTALITLVKWSVLAIIVGGVVGLVASLFCMAIGWATTTRTDNLWLVLLLPLAGLLIVWIARRSHDQSNIDTVMGALNSGKKIPWVLAPVIMVSTFISHLFGASVGREGAALQLGGSMGESLSRILRLSARDKKILIESGMAAAFSALFGTPIAAAIFPIAFTRVGNFHFAALLPCLVSSVVANRISLLMGNHAEAFAVADLTDFSALTVLQILPLAILAGLVSVLFCKLLYQSGKMMQKWFKNPYVRIFMGGLVIVAMSVIAWTPNYLGGGVDVIESAFAGEVSPVAWLLKIAFTCVAVAAGFKGGEIVPSFFIGATFGAVLAPMIGLPVDICAACGLIAVFCGVTNSPITSIVMAVELFGTSGLVLYAVTVAVSYVVSGYYGIYKQQSFQSSKFSWEDTKLHPRDVLE